MTEEEKRIRKNLTTKAWHKRNKEARKVYRAKNKEKLIEQGREYRKRNKCEIKKYISDNKDKIAQYHKVYKKEYSRNNKDRIRENGKNYYLKVREDRLCSYKENIEEHRRKNRLYAKNLPAGVSADRCAKYRKAKPQVYRAISQKRRAAKKKACPRWLTQTHLDAIIDLNKIAADLQKLDGVKRHIDHIIPFVNDKVCGLHVPWNMQVLTEHENCTKRNSFDYTYDNNSWRDKL